jgi:glycosyltransferase involved in cell wall biosynthesis
MNLLIITSHLPYPLNTGGNQAQYHIINFFRKKQINIFLVFNKNKVNSNKNLLELQKIWNDVKFYPFRWTNTKKYKEILFLKFFKSIYNKLFSGKTPFNITDTFMFEELTQDFISYIHSIIEKDNISVIQVEFDSFLPIVFSLPLNIKKIYIQHEIQFIRKQLLLESLQMHNELYQHFIFNKMKYDEISAMNNYDMVVTLTNIDKAKLLESGVITQIEFSAAGVSDKSEDNIFKGSINKLVFVGGCNHYPNLHGLEWFLEKIWERILDVNPDMVIDIVGTWDEIHKKKFIKTYKNINFLGFVNNLSSVLENAIMVVPLKIGSGMRMKILDAANYGCPFVATSIAVEGLNFKNNEDCYIEDNEIEFANKVVSLIADKKLQKIFSRNIKNIFEKKYSIDVLGERRLSLLNSLTNNKNE